MDAPLLFKLGHAAKVEVAAAKVEVTVAEEPKNWMFTGTQIAPNVVEVEML